MVPGYGSIGFNFSPESEEFFGFPMLEDSISRMKFVLSYEEKTRRNEGSVKSVENISVLGYNQENIRV